MTLWTAELDNVLQHHVRSNTHLMVFCDKYDVPVHDAKDRVFYLLGKKLIEERISMSNAMRLFNVTHSEAANAMNTYLDRSAVLHHSNTSTTLHNPDCSTNIEDEDDFFLHHG